MGSTKPTPYDIIRRPVITEKASVARSEQNAFVFEVHPRANKCEIKAAIEEVFKVKVVDVRTVNVPSKTRRSMARGTTALGKPWKKAYVILEQGASIEVVEGL